MAARVVTLRERGTTLAGLLGVLALASVIAIVAASLITAGGRARDGGVRSNFEGDASRAVAQLHRDALGTTSVTGVVGLWGGDELRLRQHDGSTVTWRMSGTTLERVARAFDGTLITRQDIARPVAVWRWRLASPGVLDVSVRTTQTWDRHRTVRVAIRGRSVSTW